MYVYMYLSLCVLVVSGMCKERPAVAGVTWCLAAPTMDQTGLHPGSISFAWKCARVLAQSPKPQPKPKPKPMQAGNLLSFVWPTKYAKLKFMRN